MHLFWAAFALPLLLFFDCCFAALASVNSKKKTLYTMDQCRFPVLQKRLMKMIAEDEVHTFEVTLVSECKGKIYPSSPNFVSVFNSLIENSLFKNVDRYLVVILREFGTTFELFSAWINHKRLVRINVLTIMRKYFKEPVGSMVYSLSIRYPIEGRERKFLNSWLLEIQGPQLRWPFSPPTSPHRVEKVKSSEAKASTATSNSWSRFTDIPGIKLSSTDLVALGEDDAKPVFEDDVEIPITAPEQMATAVASISYLHFGHIYGWVSKKGNPFVSNKKVPATICGHSVLLGNRFLGFSSSKFVLGDYSKSSKFFLNYRANLALSRKITSHPGCNFGAAFISGNRLHAALSGDISLVLFGLVDGKYEFKYPARPYTDLIQPSSSTLTRVSIEVEPSDIALLLPRTIFTARDTQIFPHDLPGAFLYVELSTFALSFLNLINYIHSKTELVGVVAVGGFIH